MRRSAGSASRWPKSWRAIPCCVRGCASSPTNSSPAPRSKRRRSVSTCGRAPISSGCSRRCSYWAPPRISRGWPAALPTNSWKRSAFLSAARLPTILRVSTRICGPSCAGMVCGSAPITFMFRFCSSRRRALWALKHGGPDIKGLDELQRLAASGRTSFPVDKEVQRSFYRTIGYRVCGERAVRVDILERLADLIRPALSWRPGSAAPPPAGAFEGIGFTVTQAMTSLTGSSGEDFASILRALGYRMEKRPKPVKVAAEAETLPAPDAAAPASDQPATGLEPVMGTVTDPPPQAEDEMAADGARVDQGPAPHDPVFPGMTLHASGESAATVTIAGDQGASDPPLPAADEVTAVAEAGTPDAPVASAGGTTVDPESPEVPGEPELRDGWRPGGRSEERRGQRRPPQWQRARQSPDRAPAANATEERTIAAADGGEPAVDAGT